MGNSILSIGISGLAAAQAGLVTTGHNIANASTAGFNRQSIIQGTNDPVFSGSGYFGQGTNVQTIKRTYNDYLDQQVMSADTRFQELDTYYAQVKQIDDLFGDTAAGLAPALQNFFTGVQSVASAPTSVPARQSMLSQASALASRFQSLSGRLNELRDLVGNDIQGSVVEINSFAKQISEVNQRIILASNVGSGQPPNDLLDQRAELISQLNQQVKVTSIPNEDGSVNLFIGNGQPLVVRGEVSELTTGPANDDISRIAVGIKLPSGGTQQLSDQTFAGGKLSGLLKFRSESLDSAQNALGRIAIGLTESFNAQHALGQDLDGALGTNFFQPISGTTIYPNKPANTGSAAIDVPITNIADLGTSDFSLSYTAANTFQLVRRSDGQVWTASAASPAAALSAVMAAAPAQGFSLNLSSGTPAVGDSFLIQPTRKAAEELSVALSDPRQIAAAAPIRTQTINTNRGTGKIDQGSVSSVAALTPPATLSLPVTLSYNAGNLSGFPAGFDVSVKTASGAVTNYPAPVGSVAFVDGATVSFAGVSVSISGQPADADKFTIEKNPGGVADSRNAVVLGGLQLSKTLIGGGASYQSAYAQLVSDVGARTREVQVTSTSQKKVLELAKDAQQSVSGVNLDEEASNLVRYQQAYQASGKVMEIANSLFADILAIARG